METMGEIKKRTDIFYDFHEHLDVKRNKIGENLNEDPVAIVNEQLDLLLTVRILNRDRRSCLNSLQIKNFLKQKSFIVFLLFKERN